jgi:D-3-phosphoglycerate dehydrogenase
MRIWKNTPTLDDYVSVLATANAAPEEADLAIVGAKKFDIRAMPNLKAVFKCGIGADNIDFDTCDELGIHVIFPSEKTTNIIYEETANFTVFLILERLYSGAGIVESWSKFPRAFLGHQIVLLIGQGNIGRRVKNKVGTLMTVNSFDTATDDIKILAPLVHDADVISLHIPLNEITRGWFDAEKLAWMKKGAALVNTSRGPIVDEDALYRELSAGRLTAAFDVFWEEPYRGKLSNLPPRIFYMTPHVASTCVDFLKSLGQDLQSLIDRMNHD